MENTTHIKDLYSLPGFRAQARLKPHPNMPGASVVTLVRRQKKASAPVVAKPCAGSEAAAFIVCATWTLAAPCFTWNSNIAAWLVRVANP